MSFSDIKAKLLRKEDLFTDPDFPANEKSLCEANRGDRVTWKRPGMIVKSGKPHFVVKSLSRFDFDQGALGDCWFIAAAATLASSSHDNFKQVVPDDQSFDEGSYAGIFRFRFWSYGSWREIVIDDYLPCNEAGLLYCKNREEPNEFWAALLEKAFAKLYGSYQRLQGGYIHYALLALTGGITEVLDLDTTPLPSPYRLYNMLARSHAMNAFIGGAIFKPEKSGAGEIGRKNGLFMGHAYSVTGFLKVTYASQIVLLLRVRNPWGRGEWLGMWSDSWLKQENLSPENRRLLYGEGLKQDGEFWISIEDFMRNFNQIQMCHLEPDSILAEVVTDMKQDDWKLVSYHGSWRDTEPESAVGCYCGSSTNPASQFPNPQYYVRLTPPLPGTSTTLVISLMEKEVRQSLQPQVYINFFIYKLRSPHPERVSVKTHRRAKLVGRGSKRFVFFKEITRRFNFELGCYVISPETYRDDAEAEFLLRIFSKGPIESGSRMILSWIVLGPSYSGKSDLHNLTTNASYHAAFALPETTDASHHAAYALPGTTDASQHAAYTLPGTTRVLPHRLHTTLDHRRVLTHRLYTTRDLTFLTTPLTHYPGPQTRLTTSLYTLPGSTDASYHAALALPETTDASYHTAYTYSGPQTSLTTPLYVLPETTDASYNAAYTRDYPRQP